MTPDNDMRASEVRMKKSYEKNENSKMQAPILQKTNSTGHNKLGYSSPGADLGFSRGGGDFQKIFQRFDDLFFLGRPN